VRYRLGADGFSLTTESLARFEYWPTIFLPLALRN
jgi:hypothetical protein